MLNQFSVHMQHIGVEVDYPHARYTHIEQVLDKGGHKPFQAVPEGGKHSINGQHF